MTLLERDSQLAILLDRHSHALSGQGRLVLVTGEAGIGKTSLVREFGSLIPPGQAPMLTGVCDPLTTPAAHAPLRDLAPDLGPEVMAHLRIQPDAGILFSVVLAALRAMPGAIVVFEDIHWADEATLDLLRYLSRRIEKASVLIIVTARDDEHAANDLLRPFLGELGRTEGCERINLLPLSEQAVSTLIGDRALSPGTLHRRSGGNPFFVAELLSTEAGLPPTVSDAVLGRLLRLPPQTQFVVQVAAVLGPGVSVDLIAAIARADVSDHLEGAIASGLMRVGPDGIGFRHELAREAILEAISPIRRQDIYRAIVDIVPERVPDPDPAWMAHYAEGAGDRAAIRQYNTLAAERASALGAHREAAHHYRTALDAVYDQPVELRQALLEGYAAATTVSGWKTEELRARVELREIYRANGDRGGEIEQLRCMSASYVDTGNNNASDAAIREATALLAEMEEGQLHGRVYGTQSHLLMLNRKNEEAISWGNRAVDVATRWGDFQTIVGAQNSIGSALILSGNQQDGKQVLEAGIAAARENEDHAQLSYLLCNLGSASGEMFHLDTAETALREGVETASDADLDGPLSYALAWLAIVRLHQGRWRESTDLAYRAIDAPHSFGVSQIMSFLALGRVRTRRGDAGAWSALDHARSLAEPTGTLQRIAPVAAARAETSWMEGNLDAVRAEAFHAFDLAVQHQHPWHVGELAYWLKLAGVDVSPECAVSTPWRLQLSGSSEEAAAAWKALGCPYEASRALLDSNDIDAVTGALRSLESLGAAPMAARAARRLRELGATTIPRGPRPETRSNPAGLTAREMEVLNLLRNGSTNSDIGAALFVSARTVAHHVSSILLKLDVSSRRDAVDAAIARGILS